LTNTKGPHGRSSFSAFLAAAHLATDEAAPGGSGSGRLRIIEPTTPWIA
jgi:hypothetical protein